MTASNTFRTLLAYLSRSIERTARKITIASATLTLSLPPFIKLEIKTEPAKPAHRRRRQVA